MKKISRIVMIASENDALKGGKVGGLADVVRDMPRALADLGYLVDVITPSYGVLHKDNVSEHIATTKFPFEGKERSAEIFRLSGKIPHKNITHYAIEYPGVRGEPIYYNDPSSTPFLRDANKYALFCSAAGQFLRTCDPPFLLHLHDWHAATIFLLKELHPEFKHLKRVPTAFTIHNVAIQGTRQFKGKTSTVQQWFPELFAADEWIKGWRDPQWKEPCYNPMLVGIRHADKVNTVSPGYAGEILQPSNHVNGFYGGEGLEDTLNEKQQQGTFRGILNGCEYPGAGEYRKLSHDDFFQHVLDELRRLSKSSDRVVVEQIQTLRKAKPAFILTSVSRIVEQKVKLLFERGSDGVMAIERITRLLSQFNGSFILIGNGIPEFEKKLREVMRLHDRFIYYDGYSDSISRALYASGTMFLMPSSFEPCGISQMIAMREGQPCIVHAVGGLKDTVINDENGFTFGGITLAEQVDEFVRAVEKGIRIYLNDTPGWSKITAQAARARFTWEKSAKEYLAFWELES